ncbi:hypothetical protein GX50_03360 [[Emmonsia] crescens]|uniref:Uncharacterized protein n=1 Tax=[Emmonsia] crescens TaxID=73230 RepID=A0A2B7ZKB4_9EURO|nr:hypothetical protein GX50_03360 [Emmonsia crescens]
MGVTTGRREGLRSSRSIVDDTKCPSAQTLFNTIRHLSNRGHSSTVELQFCYKDSRRLYHANPHPRQPSDIAVQGGCAYVKYPVHNPGRIRPTGFHAWNKLDNHLYLILYEWFLIQFYQNQAIRGFQGPYAGSEKQPDMAIVPEGEYLPTVVIESGWSEHLLPRDMRLWLVGAAGKVQLVLLFIWTKMSENNYVKGVVETWGLDPAGNERLLQREVNKVNFV